MSHEYGETDIFHDKFFSPVFSVSFVKYSPMMARNNRDLSTELLARSSRPWWAQTIRRDVRSQQVGRISSKSGIHTGTDWHQDTYGPQAGQKMLPLNYTNWVLKSRNSHHVVHGMYSQVTEKEPSNVV